LEAADAFVGGGLTMNTYAQGYWIILPILGMGLGAFAIWSEFRRQEKALEVLRVYAEKGEEPPPAVLAILNRASAPDTPTAPPWARFGFYAVMALGFGLTAMWVSQGGARTWVFTLGFGVTAFVMAAFAVQAMVSALSSPGAGTATK